MSKRRAVEQHESKKRICKEEEDEVGCDWSCHVFVPTHPLLVEANEVLNRSSIYEDEFSSDLTAEPAMHDDSVLIFDPLPLQNLLEQPIGELIDSFDSSDEIRIQDIGEEALNKTPPPDRGAENGEEEEEEYIYTPTYYTPEGHKIEIPKGFQQFPFGGTGYRYTTIGECLYDALVEVQNSGLPYRHELPSISDIDLAKQYDDYEMKRCKDERLWTIAKIFDEVLLTNMPRYLGTMAWIPDRRLAIRGFISQFKIIEKNMLLYCHDVSCRERSSRRSSGFSLISPTIKIICMDLSQLKSATLNPSRPDMFDRFKRSRRQKKMRNTNSDLRNRLRFRKALTNDDMFKMLSWGGLQHV